MSTPEHGPRRRRRRAARASGDAGPAGPDLGDRAHHPEPAVVDPGSQLAAEPPPRLAAAFSDQARAEPDQARAAEPDRARAEPDRARATGDRRRTGRPDSTSRRAKDGERGWRELAGNAPSQVGISGALRARDVARPGPAELAAAERELQIVRRQWQPPADEPPPTGAR